MNQEYTECSGCHIEYKWDGNTVEEIEDKPEPVLQDSFAASLNRRVGFLAELQQIHEAAEQTDAEKQAVLDQERDKSDRLWANAYLENTVKAKCREAAKDKRTSTYIVKVPEDALVDRRLTLDELKSKHLKGKYKHLYHACRSVGLGTMVPYCHDDVGNSWYEFWVEWK